MQRCAECRSLELRAGETAEALTVAGRTFTAQLAATVCGACGASYVSLEVLERFHLEVGRALAAQGAHAPEVIKHLRKALGYAGRDLAELLGVTVESVSRWETGKYTPDAATVATLAALVDDRLHGRTTTRDLLLARRAPPTPRDPQDLGHIKAA